MSLLADRIEKFILEKILEDQEKITILRRNELADELDCAPSQISYVLSTRFSTDRGYEVESRRGLGGYIQITRLETPRHIRISVRNEEDERDQKALIALSSLTMADVDSMLYNYLKEEIITKREAQLMHESFRILFQYITPKRRDAAICALYKEMMNFIEER